MEAIFRSQRNTWPIFLRSGIHLFDNVNIFYSPLPLPLFSWDMSREGVKSQPLPPPPSPRNAIIRYSPRRDILQINSILIISRREQGNLKAELRICSQMHWFWGRAQHAVITSLVTFTYQTSKADDLLPPRSGGVPNRMNLRRTLKVWCRTDNSPYFLLWKKEEQNVCDFLEVLKIGAYL
jgi:hypothetical protein